MNLDRPALRLAVFILSLCFALKTQALYSVLETGEILTEGSYRANLETQFVSDGDRGLNLVGHFDTWFNQDSNLRFDLGTGTTDFYTGGFFKWVPFPDTTGQPAVGFSTGVIFARNGGIDEIAIRIRPLVSKKISTEIGEINPYASIPVGISSRDGEGSFPIHLVGGLEWKTDHWEHITFIGEFGVNINEAFSYFSLSAQVYWDQNEGFSLD